jgi:4-aminobutyrate aminotransferase and related aminotransferases
MSGYLFSMIPKTVQKVKSKYRRIATQLPVPESLSIFSDLDRYESRSMHGQLPVVWDRAEGYQVFDSWGNCWIDFTSTIFVANTGHANEKIVDSLISSVNRHLLHTYTFTSKVRAEFLKKLIEMLPAQFEKAFLLSAGTEATECALKLMRLYGQSIHSDKRGIVSFRGAMHGRTMGAEMLKGDPKQSSWIGYMDPNIYHLPFPYPWCAKDQNDNQYDWGQHFSKDMENLKTKGLKFENISGFIIESYLGWGAIFYPEAYIKAMERFARQYNCLITFDEIQGGFGRTGKLFCYQHYGVEPDLLCLGKAISGSLPLSAVVGSRKIMDLPEFGSMSSTHSANPLCCAAALANLEAIEADNLIEKSATKGALLHRLLHGIKNKYSHRISYVFGKGLLAGVLFKDPQTGDPDSLFPSLVCERAMQKGLLLVHTGRESIKIGPPLTIPEEALIEGIEVFDESIQEIENESAKS